MDTIHGEGDHRRLVGSLPMDGESGESFQSGGGLLEEGLLVGRDGGVVETVKILEGGAQADGSRDVGGARLETLRRGGEGGFLDGASGGDASDAGFMISASSANGRVLGFSLTGATISAG